MITLFNTRDQEITAPAFIGNKVYNSYSDLYICLGELDDGWLYKLSA